MLDSAALLVMLVSGPSLTPAAAPRTDLTTLRTLVVQAASAVARRPATEWALTVARPSLADEVRAALRARAAPGPSGLKVAPH